MIESFLDTKASCEPWKDGCHVVLKIRRSDSTNLMHMSADEARMLIKEIERSLEVIE